MPRVVPSDVVAAADRMFPHLVNAPNSFPAIGSDAVPRLAAFARLVESVPPELITLGSGQYAGLLACVEFLRTLGEAFRHQHHVISLNLEGYNRNPMALIREAMAACPDEAPAPATVGLAFIPDSDLRRSIRLDISAANQNLAQGEWKGATVLAGSAVEALLLWALQKHEKHAPGAAVGVVAALLAAKTLKRDPGPDLEGPGWHLHEYVEVAAHLGVIKPDSASQVRLAKDARNLVHPGRAARLGQKCDRFTALAALAAVEAVARDLTLP